MVPPDLNEDTCSHRDKADAWLPRRNARNALLTHAFFSPASTEIEHDDIFAWLGSRKPLDPQVEITQTENRQTHEKTEEVIRETFRRATEQWRLDTLILSSIRDKISHPQFQEIIELGRKHPELVIPLVLSELRDRPTHWFAALQDLAPEGPTGLYQSFSEAREAWLKWGIQRGYLGRRPSQHTAPLQKARPKRKLQKNKRV